MEATSVGIMKTIEIDGVIYEVLDPKVHGYKKGFAYERDGKDYIYGGKRKGKEPFLPGYFYKVNGDFVYIEPEPAKKDLYISDRVIELSDSGIINAVNEDKFKEVDPSIIESSEEYFAPDILDSDDMLKRIVKRVLAEKKLSFKSAKTRFKNEYDITNMKSALMKPSMMSMRYFNKWVELTDITSITVTANFKDAAGGTQSVTEVIDYVYGQKGGE